MNRLWIPTLHFQNLLMSFQPLDSVTIFSCHVAPEGSRPRGYRALKEPGSSYLGGSKELHSGWLTRVHSLVKLWSHTKRLPTHYYYTLVTPKTDSSNSEAGPAVSRKPKQIPFRGPLSTYALLGLTTDVGSMTLRRWHEPYCQMGWSSPSSLHQLLPVSNILIAGGSVVTLLSPPINWKLIWTKPIFSTKAVSTSTHSVQLHMFKATGPSGRDTGEQGLLLLATSACNDSGGVAKPERFCWPNWWDLGL